MNVPDPADEDGEEDEIEYNDEEDLDEEEEDFQGYYQANPV